MWQFYGSFLNRIRSSRWTISRICRGDISNSSASRSNVIPSISRRHKISLFLSL